MDPVTAEIIFVVGNSRSGTTLMGRILGLNSQVKTFGELHFFEQLIGIEEFSENTVWEERRALNLVEQLIGRAREGFFARFVPGRYENDALAILSQTTSLNPVELYATFLSQEARRVDRRIPCEQTPRYLFSVNEILSAYPNARVINMIRDPRDVVMSQRLKWRRRFLGAKNIPIREAIRAWCNYHPYIASRMWVSSIDYATSIENERFISVYFEELVSRPDDELRRICGFLGLPFEQKMVNVNQVGSSLGRDNSGEKGFNKCSKRYQRNTS